MEPTTWNLDPTHSTIGFTVRHMVFAKVRGRFASYAGTVLAPAGDWTQGQVDVRIEAASIDTGVADRDAHLRSADFFDVDAFEALTFRSDRVEAVGDDRFRLHGQLTIRDVTRPVVLEATLGGTGKDPWGNDRVAFTAKTRIDRFDYGLKWNQALEAGGVLVGRNVDIELDVQAVRAAAADAA
jgi:polyisoprenoid-binding protein YceI